MVPEKRLFRSHDALLGGVCAGVAEYFDIDPVVVRILTVLLTLVTGGVFAVAYLALWVVLPQAPDQAKPVDVHPESVHSETYGQVRYQQPDQGAAKRSSSSAAAQVAAGYAARTAYPGTGHVPPEPPVSFQHDVPFGGPSPVQGAIPVPPAYRPPDAAYSAQPTRPASGKAVRAALWFGFACLGIGLAALFGNSVVNVEWWQFWPLFLVIVGIGQIVVPARKGERIEQFVGGVNMFFLGLVLLAMSLDVISYRSIVPMIMDLWPLLLMMIGFSILAGALEAPAFKFGSCLCFVAFCVVGTLWFSIPGSTETMTLILPFKEAITLNLRPWW